MFAFLFVVVNAFVKKKLIHLLKKFWATKRQKKLSHIRPKKYCQTLIAPFLRERSDRWNGAMCGAAAARSAPFPCGKTSCSSYWESASWRSRGQLAPRPSSRSQKNASTAEIRDLLLWCICPKIPHIVQTKGNCKLNPKCPNESIDQIGIGYNE